MPENLWGEWDRDNKRILALKKKRDGLGQRTDYLSLMTAALKASREREMNILPVMPDSPSLPAMLKEVVRATLQLGSYLRSLKDGPEPQGRHQPFHCIP